MNEVDNDAVPLPSQRRLQRPPDFTGGVISSFREVFLRHGLPGALLGAVCLLHPDLRGLLGESLSGLQAEPLRYLTIGLVILGGLVAYAWFLERKIDGTQLGWTLYLLCISIWEEWVFRLAIPYFAEANGVDLRAAVIASNLAFGLMHYFTLRWKWYWCVAAFLGGMALSRQMEMRFDLAFIIGIHWIATFINTPRAPRAVSRKRTV